MISFELLIKNIWELSVISIWYVSYNNRNPALGVLWPGPQDAQRRVAIIVTNGISDFCHTRGGQPRQDVLLWAFHWVDGWSWGSAAYTALLQHRHGRHPHGGPQSFLTAGKTGRWTALHTGKWHIEAETKWKTFCRHKFQMYFLE